MFRVTGGRFAWITGRGKKGAGRELLEYLRRSEGDAAAITKVLSKAQKWWGVHRDDVTLDASIAVHILRVMHRSGSQHNAFKTQLTKLIGKELAVMSAGGLLQVYSLFSCILHPTSLETFTKQQTYDLLPRACTVRQASPLVCLRLLHVLHPCAEMLVLLKVLDDKCKGVWGSPSRRFMLSLPQAVDVLARLAEVLALDRRAVWAEKVRDYANKFVARISSEDAVETATWLQTYHALRAVLKLDLLGALSPAAVERTFVKYSRMLSYKLAGLMFHSEHLPARLKGNVTLKLVSARRTMRLETLRTYVTSSDKGRQSLWGLLKTYSRLLCVPTHESLRARGAILKVTEGMLSLVDVHALDGATALRMLLPLGLLCEMHGRRELVSHLRVRVMDDLERLTVADCTLLLRSLRSLQTATRSKRLKQTLAAAQCKVWGHVVSVRVPLDDATILLSMADSVSCRPFVSRLLQKAKHGGGASLSMAQITSAQKKVVASYNVEILSVVVDSVLQHVAKAWANLQKKSENCDVSLEAIGFIAKVNECAQRFLMWKTLPDTALQFVELAMDVRHFTAVIVEKSLAGKRHRRWLCCGLVRVRLLFLYCSKLHHRLLGKHLVYSDTSAPTYGNLQVGVEEEMQTAQFRVATELAEYSKLTGEGVMPALLVAAATHTKTIITRSYGGKVEAKAHRFRSTMVPFCTFLYTVESRYIREAELKQFLRYARHLFAAVRGSLFVLRHVSFLVHAVYAVHRDEAVDLLLQWHRRVRDEQKSFRQTSSEDVLKLLSVFALQKKTDGTSEAVLFLFKLYQENVPCPKFDDVTRMLQHLRRAVCVPSEALKASVLQLITLTVASRGVADTLFTSFSDLIPVRESQAEVEEVTSRKKSTQRTRFVSLKQW